MRTDTPEGAGFFLQGPEAMDITDEKFNEMTKTVTEMLEVHLGVRDDISPVIFVFFKTLDKQSDGKTYMLSDIEMAIFIIGSDFNEHNEKMTITRGIGEECFKNKYLPVAAFMASEAWVSTVKVDDYKPDMRMNVTPPSQDPNKKECIIIAGKTPFNDCKVGVMIPVRRNDKNIMERDGDNSVVKEELKSPLLNQFFIGFRDAALSTMKSHGGRK
jgi:hypothetical protein